MEPRLLMTVNTWAVAGGGDWDAAANWSLHHVPLASEDVVIGGSGAAVTHAMGQTDSAHGIVSSRPITLSAGTLNVATTIKVNALLSLAGGTLSGATILPGSGGSVQVSKGTLNNVAVDTGLTVPALGSLLITGKFSVSGPFTIDNASVTLSGKGEILSLPVTSLSGTSLVATGGAEISLPNLTSYALTLNRPGYTPTLEANGAGSLLLMPNLATLNGGAYAGQGVHVNAYDGARVSMPKLTNIVSGRAQLQASGSGAVLDLSSLTSLVGSDTTGFGTTLHASNGASILTPRLQTLSLAILEIDAKESAVGIASLTNINNASIQVTSGGSLTLSTISSWNITDSRPGFTPFLASSNNGSLLSLPNLTSINGGSAAGQGMHIGASSGAHLLLAKLSSITGGGAQLQCDGAGSTIDLSSLTALQGVRNGFQSSLTASHGGAILSPKLQRVTLAVINVLYPNSTINTSVLSDIDNTSVYVKGGAVFTLADVTSYAVGSTLSGFTPTFDVENAGSSLSLPNLTSIIGGSAGGSGLRIWALSGGHIALARLQSIHGAASLRADGSGSLLNFSSLTSFTYPNNGFASGKFATNGGVIQG